VIENEDQAGFDSLASRMEAALFTVEGDYA